MMKFITIALIAMITVVGFAQAVPLTATIEKYTVTYDLQNSFVTPFEDLDMIQDQHTAQPGPVMVSKAEIKAVDVGDGFKTIAVKPAVYKNSPKVKDTEFSQIWTGYAINRLATSYPENQTVDLVLQRFDPHLVDEIMSFSPKYNVSNITVSGFPAKLGIRSEGSDMNVMILQVLCASSPDRVTKMKLVIFPVATANIQSIIDSVQIKMVA